MRREENPGGGNEVITLLIVGVGGYFLYNYLVSSGMWAQWFGGAAAGASGTVAQQIAAGLQTGAFVQAGTDAQGNIIVHQVATGAYYAVNPTTGAVSQASGPGGGGTVGTQPTTTVPITTPNPVATTPAPVTLTTASPIAQQLNAYATQYVANMQAAGTPAPGGGLTVNQWLYYYQIIKGANPANQSSFTMYGTPQEEAIIQSLGLTDATAGTTIISLPQFINALNGAGLSGIVRVPNQGPITAPLPTSQNFNRGYGGYPGGRREMRKGYLN